jgi:phosphate transport system substrate-binding protein
MTRLGGLGIALAIAASGCGDKSYDEKKPPPARITVDGSSTVLPITQHVAASYAARSSTIIDAIGSGTGAGFKKLCIGKVALVGASRPITPVEIQACGQAGIHYIEMPVAFDGIAVVVHPENTWAASMTVAELKKLWEPAAQSAVRRWSDLRAGWPDEPITLHGPGAESGTFDYFTRAIVGEEKASRSDFRASEDDDVLVAGVAGDRHALGYFGISYFQKNQDRLRLVAIDDGNPANGAGAIAPGPDTIAAGTYQPLSRPLFLYVSATAAGHRQTENFIEYYLDHAADAAAAVGTVALPPQLLTMARRRFRQRQPGSAFASGGIEIGLTLPELLDAETATVVAEPTAAAKPTATN